MPQCMLWGGRITAGSLNIYKLIKGLFMESQDIQILIKDRISELEENINELESLGYTKDSNDLDYNECIIRLDELNNLLYSIS